MSPSEAIEEAKAVLDLLAKRAADLSTWYADEASVSISLRMSDLRRASRALAALNEGAVSGLTEFVASQEPLGAEFEKVWDDNAAQLYTDGDATTLSLSGLTEEEAVRKLATVIAHAMFSEGEKSPTVAGYQRAARAALEALKGEAK